jgi:hypothetical protein
MDGADERQKDPSVRVRGYRPFLLKEQEEKLLHDIRAVAKSVLLGTFLTHSVRAL